MERKNMTVLKHYIIKEKIGHGAFGEIYLAINKEDNSEVALKIENSMNKRSQLLYESKIIMDLAKTKKIGE